MIVTGSTICPKNFLTSFAHRKFRKYEACADQGFVHNGQRYQPSGRLCTIDARKLDQMVILGYDGPIVYLKNCLLNKISDLAVN